MTSGTHDLEISISSHFKELCCGGPPCIMSALASAGTVVGPRGPMSTPTGRRVMKRKIDDQGKESNKSSRYATRTTTNARTIEVECATDIKNGNSSDRTDEGGATLQSALDLLGQYRVEFQGMKEAIKEQSETIRNQQETIRELKEAAEGQQNCIRDLSQRFEDTKQQIGHDLKRAHELLEAIAARAPATPPVSFADVTRSSPSSEPSNKIVSAVERVHTERMEVIHEYALPPWTSRIPVVGENDLAKAAKAPNDIEGIIIATSSSKKGGIVGMGGVARNATRNNAGEVVTSYSVTLGPGDEQNPYTAELAAIAMALECTPPRLPFRDVTVMTSNRSAVEVIRRPRQQSGQCTIRQIYDRAKCLRKRGCSVRVMWVPAKVEGFALGPMAKAAAQRATKADTQVAKAARHSDHVGTIERTTGANPG
ncbi:reverse transcriptase [Ilyonectria robusta]